MDRWHVCEKEMMFRQCVEEYSSGGGYEWYQSDG